MISHLPVTMDGSCNGYQHLSAMGLDPIVGRATNLMGFDDLEDIYQRVSDLVCRRMEREARARQGEALSNAARARAERERGSAKPQSKGEASSDPEAPGNYWPSWIANSQRMQR